MRVFVLAGEASGDRLGAALMAGLKTLAPGATFLGVGGAAMQAEGLRSLFPMEELSVMGLAEVLPRYRQLRRRLEQVVDAVLEAAPDVLVTVDSPDFCLRVAARVRARARIRAVHYVAPTVWAWRPKRAAKMARAVDQVLALLPFEPPFMEAVGLRCDFVGHPVAAEPVAAPEDVARLRAAEGLGEAPVLLVLPGSRPGEVARLAPIFGVALRPILAARPDLRLVVPAAPGMAAGVRRAVRDWPAAPLVLDPDVGASPVDRKRAAFATATAALAASGTVSLELAAAATPMVIAYDMNWITREIVLSLLRVDSVTLVNLVSGRRVVPEFIGRNCRPDRIAPALERLLSDPAARAGQLRAMEETMAALGRGGEAPGLRAARAVLDGLGAAGAM